MPVSMGKPPEPGPGFGCTCRAFRLGEPTPEQALAALARSANVTVEDKGHGALSEYMFRAWTEPENHYIVTYDPNRSGGWCKHTIACLSHFAPWHRQLALGADQALNDIRALATQNRKMLRSIAKLEKEIEKRDREIAKLRG